MSDTVVIKSGETVMFPVTSDNPLAKYQQQVDVSQVSNLHDLAVVRMITRSKPHLVDADITAAVRSILNSNNVSTILQLTLPDLVVQQGATMTLGGPITTITAGNVYVLGEIRVFGTLNFSCTTVGGFLPPTVSGISPTTGSTLGGFGVAIQGEGLSNATAVYFGNLPATSFQQISNSYIVAFAPPAQPGPIDVTVLVYGALRSAISAADIFTYAYLPGVASITVSPILWTGSSATCMITLNEPATSGDSTVTLSVLGNEGTTFSGITLSTSALEISSGATSGSVQILASASAWGAVTITAIGPDGMGQSSTLVVVVAGQIILSQALLTAPSPPGQPITFTVYVRTPAPSSGGQITLSATNPNHLTISGMPSSIALAGGTTSAQFVVVPTLSGSAIGSITINATYESNSASTVIEVSDLHLPPRRPGGPFPV